MKSKSDFFTWQLATVYFEKNKYVTLKVFVNQKNITSLLTTREYYRILWEMNELFERRQSEEKYWEKWGSTITSAPHVFKNMFVRVPLQ